MKKIYSLIFALIIIVFGWFLMTAGTPPTYDGMGPNYPQVIGNTYWDPNYLNSKGTPGCWVAMGQPSATPNLTIVPSTPTGTSTPTGSPTFTPSSSPTNTPTPVTGVTFPADQAVTAVLNASGQTINFIPQNGTGSINVSVQGTTWTGNFLFRISADGTNFTARNGCNGVTAVNAITSSAQNGNYEFPGGDAVYEFQVDSVSSMTGAATIIVSAGIGPLGSLCDPLPPGLNHLGDMSDSTLQSAISSAGSSSVPSTVIYHACQSGTPTNFTITNLTPVVVVPTVTNKTLVVYGIEAFSNSPNANTVVSVTSLTTPVPGLTSMPIGPMGSIYDPPGCAFQGIGLSSGDLSVTETSAQTITGTIWHN